MPLAIVLACLPFAAHAAPKAKPTLDDISQYCNKQFYDGSAYGYAAAVRCIKEGRYVPPRPAPSPWSQPPVGLPRYTAGQCVMILNYGGTDAEKAYCTFPDDPVRQAEFLRELTLTRAANPADYTIRNR
jgi:hypothetical protein